jgi:hypothetical protein
MYIDPNDKEAIEEAVLYGMAKGPWSIYWANEQEELQGQSFSGTDIYEAAPDSPGWAKKWAKKVSLEIVKLNKTKLGIIPKLGKTSIANIAQLIFYTYPEKVRPNYEEIGVWLGCQAAGSGISWTDNLPGKAPFSLKVPQYEFYPS